jgi:hypothetical protein
MGKAPGCSGWRRSIFPPLVIPSRKVLTKIQRTMLQNDAHGAVLAQRFHVEHGLSTMDLQLPVHLL